MREGRSAAENSDWVAASRSWAEAAKLGSLDGANLLSRTAAPHIRQAADAGDVEAQAVIAGIMMDYFDESAFPMAAGYAARAAEAGSAEAQRTLGLMYDRGIGVEQDSRRAAELWTEATRGGDGYAAFNLAGLHRRGEVLLSGEEECDQLLILAAERGVTVAGAALGNRLAAVDRDEEALTWYLWSAERGEPSSMFAAACWYRDGIGTPRNPVQAVRWYFTMLDHGNGDGVHEALQLARSGMTEEQIREAARLAGRPGDAEATIHVLRSSPDA
jgi:TPR repeat protein